MIREHQRPGVPRTRGRDRRLVFVAENTAVEAFAVAGWPPEPERSCLRVEGQQMLGDQLLADLATYRLRA
jgi:hypothetical protein